MKVNLKAAALLIGMSIAGASFGQTQTSGGGPLAPGANAAAGASAGAFSGAGASSGAFGNVTNFEQTYEATKVPTETKLINEHTGTYTLRTAPTIGVPNIFPTAPCMGSSALGVSVVGTGVSGGTSWVYENCEHRENSRLLHAMGDVQNAKIALCMQSTMTEHPMCKAMKPAPQPAPAKVSSVDPRDPKVVIQSDQMKADQMIRTKSRDDAVFTKAALAPTEKERLAINCNYAKEIGDNILAGRFGCPGVGK